MGPNLPKFFATIVHEFVIEQSNDGLALNFASDCGSTDLIGAKGFWIYLNYGNRSK